MKMRNLYIYHNTFILHTQFFLFFYFYLTLHNNLCICTLSYSSLKFSPNIGPTSSLFGLRSSDGMYVFKI